MVQTLFRHKVFGVLFQIDLRDDGVMVGVADAGDGVRDGAEMRRIKNIIDADERPEK